MKTFRLLFCGVIVAACTVTHDCLAVDCWVADEKDTCEELYGPRKKQCGEINDCRFNLEADSYICDNAYNVDEGENAILSVRKKRPSETGYIGVIVHDEEVRCGTYRTCECQFTGPEPTQYQCANESIWQENLHKNKSPYGDQHSCMPSGYGGGGDGGYGEGYGG